MDILLVFMLLFPGIRCVTYTAVASGVFLVSDANVSFAQAQETCDCYNATLATSSQLEISLTKKFSSCNWGWVKEKRLMMVRAFGNIDCAQNKTGLLSKYIEAQTAMCYKSNAVKGVFQVKIAEKYNLMLEDGNRICETWKATFSTQAQLENAYSEGYETCRSGWVQEGKTFILRHTKDPKCVSGKIGFLQTKDLDGFSDVYCFRRELENTSTYAPSPSTAMINYTEASLLCSSFGDFLANAELMSNVNVTELVMRGITNTWFQNGIAVVVNQSFELQPRMNDTNITAAVYCYDSQALDYIPVISQEKIVASGVFQVEDALVNYTQANDTCATRNATLANLTQVEKAYDNKFQTCKWGWVDNTSMELVMVRLYSNESCVNFKVGILHLPSCETFKERYVICARNVTETTKDLYTVYHPNRTDIAYTEIAHICSIWNYTVASKKDIEAHQWLQDLKGWCQEGLLQIRNKTVDLLCADNMTVKASVYCYNSIIEDRSPEIIITSEEWRKIAMGCILGGIFVILLFAAFFMKGNEFICCLGKKNATYDEMVDRGQSYVPQNSTWNTTSIYQPMKEGIDPKFQNPYQISIKNRPPAIRPEMLKYRSHFYDNLSFITTEDE